MLVNVINAFETGKDEWYDDEQIHRIESMAEIVEPNESLKIPAGIGNNLRRRWGLIRFCIDEGTVDRKN